MAVELSEQHSISIESTLAVKNHEEHFSYILDVIDAFYNFVVASAKSLAILGEAFHESSEELTHEIKRSGLLGCSKECFVVAVGFSNEEINEQTNLHELLSGLGKVVIFAEESISVLIQVDCIEQMHSEVSLLTLKLVSDA